MIEENAKTLVTVSVNNVVWKLESCKRNYRITKNDNVKHICKLERSALQTFRSLVDKEIVNQGWAATWVK